MDGIDTGNIYLNYGLNTNSLCTHQIFKIGNFWIRNFGRTMFLHKKKITTLRALIANKLESIKGCFLIAMVTTADPRTLHTIAKVLN